MHRCGCFANGRAIPLFWLQMLMNVELRMVAVMAFVSIKKVLMNVNAETVIGFPSEGSVLVSSKYPHTRFVDLISFADIDECAEGTHNCDHNCVNTDGSYACSCNDGLFLQPDGHSCQCSGRLTAASGSFQTPSWPLGYPVENFQCEWIVDLPNPHATVQFTIDDTAFGIDGHAPCRTDHIEFFDGGDESANSLEKICGLLGFYGGAIPHISSSSSMARVVFTGHRRLRPRSRVGVRVHYVSITPPGMWNNTASFVFKVCVAHCFSFQLFYR